MPDPSVDDFCFDMSHYRETCPGCGGDVGWECCHFTYTTWRCLGCFTSRWHHRRGVQVLTCHVCNRDDPPEATTEGTSSE